MVVHCVWPKPVRVNRVRAVAATVVEAIDEVVVEEIATGNATIALVILTSVIHPKTHSKAGILQIQAFFVVSREIIRVAK